MNLFYRGLVLEHLPANEVLFHAGEPGNHYYIILQGKVSVKVPIQKMEMMSDVQMR